MKKLFDWSAKRAGGRITINGRAEGPDGKAGLPVKVPGVDRIEPRGGRVIAIDKNSVEYDLVVAS